jgi:TRAP-type C4-dicarboxylate transport system permease small subunit
MSTMERLSARFGRLIEWFALAACVLVFLMMVVICVDVFVRNVPLGPVRSVPGANEVSELTLYAIAMLAAPWLLRQGQHIRVDIVLRAIPKRLAWYCEWAVDFLGLACCIVMAWYGTIATWKSFSSGALTIKSIVWPEWIAIAPLPITFILLAIETLFRMHRLAIGERGPRNDAVNAS